MPTYLEQMIQETCDTPEFITHEAVLDLIADILDVMDATGMTRSELADRAHLDPAQITRILGGDHNMTARTMGKLASAIGRRLKITMTESCSMGSVMAATVIPVESLNDVGISNSKVAQDDPAFSASA